MGWAEENTLYMHTVERVLLLVGDVLQRVLEEYLTHEGVHVIACDSEDHLRETANPAGDVVVLEYWRRGDEHLNDTARRDLARLGRIAPTVLLTTHDWARTARAGELGISAILELPFELASLWAAVRRAVGGDSAPALAAWKPQPILSPRLN